MLPQVRCWNDPGAGGDTREFALRIGGQRLTLVIVVGVNDQVIPGQCRHACGFKLANDGHDTRALQHYLGHKNIQHTVRYTEMALDRFKDFWRD